ncbi:MAG: hypothetical protein ABI983_00070, partial [Acidobacteriota bacterium]
MKQGRHSRRAFINVTGTAMAGIAGVASIDLAAHASQAAPAGPATIAGQDPDLIVINAKVYTMDTRAPLAEAFAVKAGTFTAVGSSSDIRNLAGKNTQTFDAKGMT